MIKAKNWPVIVLKMTNKEKIWQIVNQIPKGKVASYGLVASLAGLPGYARYVGYTLKNLPAGSKLPWHRVINSKGSISFKQDTKRYYLQKSLLEEEGVSFSNGKYSMKKYEWMQKSSGL